ncbi:MAG: vitamin B12 dependent methionine synthase [Chloroflexota bacterium]
MEAIVLDAIPFQPELAPLLEWLHVKPDDPMADDLRALVAEAQAVARPQATYGLAYVADKSDDGVVIEGVAFSSRVLRVNLERCYHVFPYLATCGTELNDHLRILAADDVLLQFWGEAIKQAALGAAMAAFSGDLAARFSPGQTSAMNPGSLQDWPLRQQIPLFQLFGETAAQIGITLTPSCLMEPNKTVSGIRFPTEESFASCQLCPREGCPGRRAPFEPDLYERKYGLPAQQP